MAQIWFLLFGLLASGHGQIIYPDEYEKMMTSTFPPYVYTNTARASGNNVQSTQYDRQNNQESFGSAAQAAPVRPLYTTTARAAYYPTETPATYYTTTAPVVAGFQPAATATISSQPLPQNWNNDMSDIIAKGITNFSLDLDKAIYDTRDRSTAIQDENVVFSPLSISVALAMVLAGSAGRTFDEVSRVLGLQSGVDISRHSEIVHRMFGQMLATLNHRVEENNGPRVNSASSIFVQDGYPIRSQFLAITKDVYESEVINLDFQRRGREAQNVINNWVKQRTMGKITSILGDVPNPLTSVILASALYFNGEWNQHFIDGATRRKEFFVEPNGEAIGVDMMYNGGPFPFYEDRSQGVKVLALPYKGSEMTMYVLLPKAEGAAALKRFRDQLTAEIIENLISNLKSQTCIIGLPRMKLSSTLRLNKALRNMGLTSLFNPTTADLSLLSGGYNSQQAPVAARPFTTLAAASPVAVTSPPLSIPQELPQALLQASPQAFPQALPQALPQTSPQVLPSQGSVKSTDNIDYLIFSRFGEGSDNQDVANGARRNYFRYDDKRHGIAVEQWGTGFHISKIRRTRRDIDDKSNDTSRITHTATEDNDDLPRNNKIDDNAPLSSHDYETAKYVGLEKNKHRFRTEQRVNRERRQSPPMDESLLRFIQSQNFPPYGLDDLRNSANLLNPGLFADEVLHKVEMDVTERGTEAAATTSVLLDRDGNQKRLVANRPFLFFIRHDPTKLVLFWGTVNKPTPNYAVVR